MPTFISLEGLSGVGKTELSELVARKIKGEFVHLTADFGVVKPLMNSAEDVDARMCLFITAMLYSSVRIRRRLQDGISVVVDGFIARTLAYHQGMGASISIKFGNTVQWPDHSIMLTCEEAERRRRLAARNRKATLWDEIELANLEKIRTFYLSNRFPQIDTTFRSTESIATEILKICGLE